MTGGGERTLSVLTYIISTLLVLPAPRSSAGPRLRSTGGAVPTCFLIPFVLATTLVALSLISHVGGKSTGAPIACMFSLGCATLK